MSSRVAAERISHAVVGCDLGIASHRDVLWRIMLLHVARSGMSRRVSADQRPLGQRGQVLEFDDGAFLPVSVDKILLTGDGVGLQPREATAYAPALARPHRAWQSFLPEAGGDGIQGETGVTQRFVAGGVQLGRCPSRGVVAQRYWRACWTDGCELHHPSTVANFLNATGLPIAGPLRVHPGGRSTETQVQLNTLHSACWNVVPETQMRH
jgi:hypothetical protein